MKLPFDSVSTRLHFAVLGLLGFLLAMPFIWMAGASFKSRAEIEAGGVHVVPQEVHAENYPVLFGEIPEPVTGEKLELKFGRWFFNSQFTPRWIRLSLAAIPASRRTSSTRPV